MRGGSCRKLEVVDLSIVCRTDSHPLVAIVVQRPGEEFNFCECGKLATEKNGVLFMFSFVSC